MRESGYEADIWLFNRTFLANIYRSYSISPVPWTPLSSRHTIGPEPGRAKRESRITCMRMLITPSFFPLNRGKNHIWKYFPDSACGAIFWIIIYKQQFLHWDWLQTCQLIPNQWNLTGATLNHIWFIFCYNIKDNERNLCKTCWQLKYQLGLKSARAALCKWATCTRQTFLSKTFANSLNMQKQHVWEKSNDAYSLSIRVQTRINHISIFTFLCFFFTTISMSTKIFFFRARG